MLETGSRDVAAVLADLDTRGVRRVYVEGGPTLASAVIAAGLADEYAVYLAPALLGGPRVAIGELGIRTMAAARRLRLESVERLGDDLLLLATPASDTPASGAATRTGPATASGTTPASATRTEEH